MRTYTAMKRWVGSFVTLGLVVSGAASAGSSHTSDPAAQKGAGYVRPRADGDYETVGEATDDARKQMELGLIGIGALSEPATGEKKETPEQQLVKNQKRPGLAEPTPVPVF